MKSLIRTYLIHLLALWLTISILHPSFSIGGGFENVLVTALMFGVFNVLVKPVLKLLFLPINMLTVGLFSIVINTFLFYLTLKISPAAQLNPWTFPGFTGFGITLDPISLGLIATMAVAAILIVSIANFLTYLVK